MCERHCLALVEQFDSSQTRHTMYSHLRQAGGLRCPLIPGEDFSPVAGGTPDRCVQVCHPFLYVRRWKLVDGSHLLQ